VNFNNKRKTNMTNEMQVNQVTETNPTANNEVADTETTVVIFRKFKEGGDVIALFPNEVADPKNNCLSYQHVGQHGAADYAHVMKATVATTEEEQTPLLNELSGLGYTLKVMKRHRVPKGAGVSETV
jgi:hypothetical protein